MAFFTTSQDKTEVKTRDGASEFTYSLDEGLVEFGTAVNDNDFGRAILFLETLGDVPAAKAMWHNLANVALKQQNILVTFEYTFIRFYLFMILFLFVVFRMCVVRLLVIYRF